MKWLLITNNGNPGDIWVRLGVEVIVRHIDPKAEFNYRERDYRENDPHEGLKEPDGGLKSDCVVVCGMPLLWSHRESDGSISTTVQHASWPALTGWCCKPNRMIIAGFGLYLPCPDGIATATLADAGILPAIADWFSKCAFVYSRSPLVGQFFPGVPWLHCPSILALPGTGMARDVKLCNFMRGGAHYPALAPDAAKIMDDEMRELAPILIQSGYYFVAHRTAEAELALELGWPKGAIFRWGWDNCGVRLLDLYARCSKYIGNRIHGGIMSRANGADVIVIGYDTRIADVQSMGGEVFTPFEAKQGRSRLKSWIESPARLMPYDLDSVRQSHLDLWASKLNLPA